MAVIHDRPSFDLGDLAVDVRDLTAGGLAVETVTAGVTETDGSGRRLKLSVARTGDRRQVTASSCGGSVVGCGTMPKPIGCCCS